MPDELITQVLDAAIRAPSAINGQFARFVVVTDADKRRQLGELYLDAQLEAYDNPSAAGTEWLRGQEAEIVEKAATVRPARSARCRCSSSCAPPSGG